MLEALKFNGKTVGLLLDAPHQGEHRRDLLDTDLPARRIHQRTGPVPVVLHHAKHGNGELVLLQDPQGHPGVVLTAVDEKKVGESAEFFVPIQVPPEAPGEHLLHGAVVVGVLHIPELEMPVVPLQGTPVHKDRHGGHNIGVPRVGDIIGLDAPGRPGKAQHPSQGLHQLGRPLLPTGGPLHLFHGVLVGQANEIHLGPSLGGHQTHPVPARL